MPTIIRKSEISLGQLKDYMEDHPGYERLEKMFMIDAVTYRLINKYQQHQDQVPCFGSRSSLDADSLVSLISKNGKRKRMFKSKVRDSTCLV